MKLRPHTHCQPIASLLLVALSLGGCSHLRPATPAAPAGTPETALLPDIRQALSTPSKTAAPAAAPAGPASSPAASAPAASVGALPAVRNERRFSVVLNGAAPDTLFMALLAETSLSVAVDPAIKGPLSVSLKDVTLREALDLLRELHGLEYRVIGRHILVAPERMQTRIFNVDYPSFNRQGRSDLRVASGGITGSGSGGSSGASSGGTSGATSSNSGSSTESSRVSTSQRNDLWTEIEASVKLLVGEKEGRSVVVSPQTGNIVVRAMPRELSTVANYLETTRLTVQRQVMLEAKVVEVQLRDSERSGINWAAFRTGAKAAITAGMLPPGGKLAPTGPIGDALLSGVAGQALEATANATGSLLGLAFQTSNFAAVLDFLGTQGNTQVLSSPRIATMNNQKAVLKVGTDDFFVTNVSTTTTPVGNTTSSSPNITVQPFFSGISLDVTPHIDANGYITLHIHPAVSTVSERNKVLNLGTQGSFTLPLASSDVNETDAVVRARDGNIIAIGGLMRQASSFADSGLPGGLSEPLRKLMGGQTSRMTEKRELVILLRPTILDTASDDSKLRTDTLDRLLEWTETQSNARGGSRSPVVTPPVAEAKAALALAAPVAAPVVPLVAPPVAPSIATPPATPAVPSTVTPAMASPLASQAPGAATPPAHAPKAQPNPADTTAPDSAGNNRRGSGAKATQAAPAREPASPAPRATGARNSALNTRDRTAPTPGTKALPAALALPAQSATGGRLAWSMTIGHEDVTLALPDRPCASARVNTARGPQTSVMLRAKAPSAGVAGSRPIDSVDSACAASPRLFVARSN